MIYITYKKKTLNGIRMVILVVMKWSSCVHFAVADHPCFMGLTTESCFDPLVDSWICKMVKPILIPGDVTHNWGTLSG